MCTMLRYRASVKYPERWLGQKFINSNNIRICLVRCAVCVRGPLILMPVKTSNVRWIPAINNIPVQSRIFSLNLLIIFGLVSDITGQYSVWCSPVTSRLDIQYFLVGLFNNFELNGYYLVLPYPVSCYIQEIFTFRVFESD